MKKLWKIIAILLLIVLLTGCEMDTLWQGTNPGNNTPSNPGEVVTPGTPDDTGNPGNTDDPSTPADPSNPDDTSNPETPVEPDTPVQPSDPTETDDPTQPTTPVEPDDPTQPTDPVEPDDPMQPDPVEPDDPTQPDPQDPPQEKPFNNYGLPVIEVYLSKVHVVPGGKYVTMEEVAAYLYLYKKLPSNFVVKNNFNKKDVTTENLLSTGGDYFGNYEKLLPTGKSYRECDINYHGGSRGMERIVYSTDGLIFYTKDHYASFSIVRIIDDLQV